jgi:SAM-dependent methyltransferase/DNA-binding transcriptional ArsR family regulator
MPTLLDIFRSLADPTRVRIVSLLRNMELAVGEIAQVVDQSQPRVSRHIRILVESGLVERRKEGNWVFLRIGTTAACRSIMQIFDSFIPDEEERQEQKNDLARLSAVRADRVRAADEYFARHAQEWDAIRSLYISESEVEAAMLALAQRHAGDINAPHTCDLGRLLDIGTGTGRMIQLFAPLSSHITAIDRSPEMLRLARANLPSSASLQDAVDKYTLMLGDFSDLLLGDASVDFITAHQVLHFAQDPASVIAEAGRVLAPGGRILIADFAPHEREELRSRDQHARLGFSDEQMESWFAAAGLLMVENETLPGGDLTVKLWLGKRDDADKNHNKGL